jgi:hypothetical protein
MLVSKGGISKLNQSSSVCERQVWFERMKNRRAEKVIFTYGMLKYMKFFDFWIIDDFKIMENKRSVQINPALFFC